MPDSKKHRKHNEIDPEQTHAEQPQDTAQPDSPDGSPEKAEPQTVVDVQALQQELEQCKSQSVVYMDGWQRERADFTNYRKRVERDQAQTYQNAAGSILKRYLTIADDLARALKNRPTQGEASAWADGVELIYRKLLSLLEAEGVQRMEVDGKLFNPDFEEAISHEDSPDHESGQIIEVVQDGYMLGDRVLRPALVRVAR